VIAAERIKASGRSVSVAGLPTLPAVFDQITSLVESENVSAGRIASVISQDPALTSKILRVANSAFFGLNNEVTTVTRAVAMLGGDALKQLVLTTSVMEVFGDIDQQKLDPASIWRDSLATAAGAREIARKVGDLIPEELFVAGLLHDVGILFEMKYFADSFDEVLSLVEKEGVSLSTTEHSVFAQSHDTTGAQLLGYWKLPARLVTTAAYHHHPHRTVAFRRDVTAVAVAENVAHLLGYGRQADTLVTPLFADAWKALGLSFGALDQVADEVERAMRDAKGVLDQPPRGDA
jgi:putative nucleotidyltransferase with HDIG domain